jgi:exodeoxyribonuclease VII large subunit
VIREKKTNLKYLNQQVIAYDFNHLIALKKEKLDLNSQRLFDLTKRLLERKQEQFDRNLDKLKLLNPLSLMDKGYTYTSKDNHRIESVSDINMNDQIQTRLKDGIITSVVTNKEALTWKK